MLSEISKNPIQLKVPVRQVESVDFGGKQKLYACKLCDEKFHKQGDLKKHKKREQKWEKKKKMGEVEDYVQTGEVS